MQFPNIESDRLNLSELQATDVEDVFNLFSNQSVIAYYDLEAFSAPEQAHDLINLFKSRHKESAGIRWAIPLTNCTYYPKPPFVIRCSHAKSEMNLKINFRFFPQLRCRKLQKKPSR